MGVKRVKRELPAEETAKECIETTFYASLGQRFSPTFSGKHYNQNQQENEDNHPTCYIQECRMKFAGCERETNEWRGKQRQDKEEEKEAATSTEP